jgi:hypothetical protein
MVACRVVLSGLCVVELRVCLCVLLLDMDNVRTSWTTLRFPPFPLTQSDPSKSIYCPMNARGLPIVTVLTDSDPSEHNWSESFPSYQNKHTKPQSFCGQKNTTHIRTTIGLQTVLSMFLTPSQSQNSRLLHPTTPWQAPASPTPTLRALAAQL